MCRIFGRKVEFGCERNEKTGSQRKMLRMMCWVTLRYEVQSLYLLEVGERVGVETIKEW